MSLLSVGENFKIQHFCKSFITWSNFYLIKKVRTFGKSANTQFFKTVLTFEFNVKLRYLSLKTPRVIFKK